MFRHNFWHSCNVRSNTSSNGKVDGTKSARTRNAPAHRFSLQLPTAVRTHTRYTRFTMTRFRPCIDLHAGQVKQIVGGTFSEQSSNLKTNYVSQLPAQHFANLYQESELDGAHVIMLGPGNEGAAIEALSSWPGHLQLGGGITSNNAQLWIERGAEKVRQRIVRIFLPQLSILQ